MAESDAAPDLVAEARSPDVRALLGAVTAERQAMSRERTKAGRSIAPNFSALRFCRTDEIGLSQIICWMLDPAESHNQEADFLEAFFDCFGISHSGREMLERVCARPEVVTHTLKASQRRMDIEVRCKGFTLAIENKPYAGFQRNQVSDYCAHLATETKGAFALVILKGGVQRTPADQLDTPFANDGRVFDSDYSQLAEWVRRCVSLCKAPAVKSFLQQFGAHIESEFLTGVSMEEQKRFLQLVATPERKLAALDLIASAEGMYRELHHDFVQAVRRAAGQGWTVSSDAEGRVGRYDSAPYFMTIDFSPKVPVLFGFDLYSYDSSALVSVRPKKNALRPVARLRHVGKSLRDRLPFSETWSDSWLWWNHHTDLVSNRVLELSDLNVWKGLVEPDKAAQAVIDTATIFDQTIKRALSEFARQ